MSFLVLVVVNMLNSSNLLVNPPSDLDHDSNNNTSSSHTSFQLETEDEEMLDTKIFLEATLASQLIDAFSDSPKLAQLYNENDSAVLYDVTTPQGKAFEWILNYDQYRHSKSIIRQKTIDPSDNPTIVQRYILLVLFFATEGEYNHELGGRFNPDANKVGDWTSYGTLKFLTPSLHECSWKDKDFHGSLRGVIGCDADTKDITELMLPEVALSGELPEEIGFLSNLQALDFQNNYLGGMIPDSIGRLSSLRTLSMSYVKHLCVIVVFVL